MGCTTIGAFSGSPPNVMYVYFAIAKTAHWQRIKIGRARNVEDRIAELQVGSPTPLELLGTIKVLSEGHAKGLERALHNTFDAYRVSGEWFTAAQPLREFILASCSGDHGAAQAALDWAERQMKKRARKARIGERIRSRKRAASSLGERE